MLTPYQSQYVAWLLSRRMRGDSADLLASTLVDAQVDLNPHRVDAALFRDSARIMIATEAGAEGVNLQFCSLVINYELPWNPQRIEQRIGRCHRYGQKHDVVVVNFIDHSNPADQRIKDRCEWGHDDYSLNVANLPMAQKAPDVPAQVDLFDGDSA